MAEIGYRWFDVGATGEPVSHDHSVVWPMPVAGILSPWVDLGTSGLFASPTPLGALEVCKVRQGIRLGLLESEGKVRQGIRLGLVEVEGIEARDEGGYFARRMRIVRLYHTRAPVALAALAASTVLALFERRFTEDGRPRKAVEATILYVSTGRRNALTSPEGAARHAADAARAEALLRTLNLPWAQRMAYADRAASAAYAAARVVTDAVRAATPADQPLYAAAASGAARAAADGAAAVHAAARTTHAANSNDATTIVYTVARAADHAANAVFMAVAAAARENVDSSEALVAAVGKARLAAHADGIAKAVGVEADYAAAAAAAEAKWIVDFNRCAAEMLESETPEDMAKYLGRTLQEWDGRSRASPAIVEEGIYVVDDATSAPPSVRPPPSPTAPPPGDDILFIE